MPCGRRPTQPAWPLSCWSTTMTLARPPKRLPIARFRRNPIWLRRRTPSIRVGSRLKKPRRRLQRQRPSKPTCSPQVAADVEQVRTLSIQFDVARDRYAAAEAIAQVSTRRLTRDQQLAEYEILVENSRSLRDEIAATDPAIQANRQRLAELAGGFGESLAAIAVVRDKLIASGQLEGSLGMVKPLTAEQLAWSMLQASGRLDAVRDELESQYEAEQQAAWRARTGLPPMPRDPEHPVSPPADGESAVIDDLLATSAMVDSAAKDAYIAAQLEQKLAGSIRQFTQLFGTEPGQPPQEFAATVDQALFLSNAGVVRGWLATRNQHGLVERLMQLPDGGRVAEELYLTVLSRRPDASEIRELADLLAGDQADRREVLLESAWGADDLGRVSFQPLRNCDESSLRMRIE